MFRRVADFQKAWEQEMGSTLKVLGALSDASLGQAVTKDDRTLGRLAWHLATTPGEMMERTADLMDEDLTVWIDWFTKLFEPVLMAFIGIVIGLIVVLMYMPIFELASSVQ